VEDEGVEHTETSMNPELKGRDMRDAFDSDDYQVMIVANKFQTGFDQPKLCAMYVDKKLQGVEAVQTLSRLNRTYPNKSQVFILDFYNKAEDIEDAFAPYYKKTTLSDVTDPNMIFDLQLKLENYHIFTSQEVEQFALAFFDPNGTQAARSAAVKPAADRFKGRYKEALEELQTAKEVLERAKENGDTSGAHNAEIEIGRAKEKKDALDLFKKDLGTFVRMYEFLSQIVDYEDAELEKLSVYARGLLPNLKVLNLQEDIDLSAVEMTHFSLKNKKVQKINLKDGTLDPENPGEGKSKETKTDPLSVIIEKMNELFSGDLTDQDKINYINTVKDKVMENDAVMQQLQTNSKEQAMLGDFPVAVTDAIIGTMDAHNTLATQALSEDKIQQGFAKLILDVIYKEIKNDYQR
jgi:type I restriction enzyme R subunit